MIEPAYTFIIRNFQSIRHLELQFGGLVTITGQTDRGKSAIARALMALLHNEWHPSMLTEGEDICTLSLTFLKHPTLMNITLEKSPKKAINKYTIIRQDGTIETTPKTGLSTPESMHEIGIRKLETDRGQKINTNYESQHDGIFLLGETETTVTDIFNALFGTNLIEAALAKCNRDYQKASKEHGELSLVLQERTARAESLDVKQQELSAQLNHYKQVLADYETAVKTLFDAQMLYQNWRESRTLLVGRQVASAKSAADKIVHEQALVMTEPLRQVVVYSSAYQRFVDERKRLARVESVIRMQSAANESVNKVVIDLRQVRALRDQHLSKATMFRWMTHIVAKQGEQTEVLGVIGTTVRQFASIVIPMRAIAQATERWGKIKDRILDVSVQGDNLTQYIDNVLRPNTDTCGFCQKPIPRVKHG